MGKRFTSVQDLIRDVFPGEAKAFGDKAIAYIEGRKLCKILSIMREHEKISQAQLAEKCEWSQSKVSKIESQTDDEFTLDELRRYLKAVNMTMELSFYPSKHILAERVKLYWSRMYEALRQIAVLSKGDQEIQDGINGFMISSTSNILKVAQFCIENIKPKKKKGSDFESISILEPEAMHTQSNETVTTN